MHNGSSGTGNRGNDQDHARTQKNRREENRRCGSESAYPGRGHENDASTAQASCFGGSEGAQKNPCGQEKRCTEKDADGSSCCTA